MSMSRIVFEVVDGQNSLSHGTLAHLMINLADVVPDRIAAGRRLRHVFNTATVLLSFALVLGLNLNLILDLLVRRAVAPRLALAELEILCPIDPKIFESTDERRRRILDRRRFTASRRREHDLNARQCNRSHGRSVETKFAIDSVPHANSRKPSAAVRSSTSGSLYESVVHIFDHVVLRPFQFAQTARTVRRTSPARVCALPLSSQASRMPSAICDKGY